MAQGKSKKVYGKKGQKKKVIDSLSRKEWFELKAPAPFQSESFGYTCANRTQGLRKVEDSIRGRVVSQMQADLAPNQDTFHWRKIKLIVDQVEGRQAVTSFYGIDITKDELCSLIKKRKTLIEAVQDVRTADGYLLRIFAICFTKETPGQKRKTNYAKASQQQMIRRKMNDIIAKEVTKSNATQVLNLFTSEVIEKKITKDVSPIYPVKNVKVRKIKVIQRPNIDYHKLNEMHDPEKRILTKAMTKVTGKRGKVTHEQNVDAENLVNK